MKRNLSKSLTEDIQQDRADRFSYKTRIFHVKQDAGKLILILTTSVDRFRLIVNCQQEVVLMTNARERIETWRVDYNTQRPHRSLRQLTPFEYKEKAGKNPMIKKPELSEITA